LLEDLVDNYSIIAARNVGIGLVASFFLGDLFHWFESKAGYATCSKANEFLHVNKQYLKLESIRENMYEYFLYNIDEVMPEPAFVHSLTDEIVELFYDCDNVEEFFKRYSEVST
jgi:hypothetical protein